MNQNNQKSEIVPMDEDEGREVTVGALAALNASEINQQIATAKAYPRNITSFRQKVLTFATMDDDIARSCMYALKRRDSETGENKPIEGPSARFAEIVAQTWGNCRAGARVVEIGETHITAQGFFYDLENNVAISYEVMRRIVGKVTDKHPNGKRFGADMIGVTGNAACSIALRNAVFKGVPKAYWNHGYLAARAVIAGTMENIGERRTKMLKAFRDQFKVDPEQVYALIGVKGAPDITLDHMVFLGGLFTALESGETTVERAFDPENFERIGGGVMTPSQPTRSEFSREESEEKKQPETEKKEPAKDDGMAAEKVSTQKGDEEEKPPVDAAEEARARREVEYNDLLKDSVKELQSFAGLRELTNYYDGAAQNIVGDARLRIFTAAFDARHKEILDTKKTTGKKS